MSQHQWDPLNELRPAHFGVTFVGANAKMKYTYADNLISRDSVLGLKGLAYPGVGFGGIFAVRVNEHFEGRFLLTLNLLQRGFEYKFRDRTDKVNIETVSMDVPVLLKYKSSRHKALRYYVIGGGRYTHDFQSNELAQKAPNKPLVAIKRNMFYYEFGVGLEFSAKYIVVCPEIKMSNSVSNVLVQDNFIYAGSLRSLYPRIWQFSISFEY